MRSINMQELLLAGAHRYMEWIIWTSIDEGLYSS